MKYPIEGVNQFIPKKPINPCDPKCPERSGDCHGWCPKYDNYFRENKVWHSYIREQKAIEMLLVKKKGK